MPTDKDVKSLGPELADPVIPDMNTPDAERLPAGRIIHDDRGNAVWKWIGETSNSGTGSGILKHLDASDLKVEGQSGPLAPPAGTPPRAPDPGAGYDPYNQTSSQRLAVPRKSSGTKR